MQNVRHDAERFAIKQTSRIRMVSLVHRMWEGNGQKCQEGRNRPGARRSRRTGATAFRPDLERAEGPEKTECRKAGDTTSHPDHPSQPFPHDFSIGIENIAWEGPGISLTRLRRSRNQAPSRKQKAPHRKVHAPSTTDKPQALPNVALKARSLSALGD